MDAQAETAFQQLRAQVEARFQAAYPGTGPMADWTGQDIVRFQEDLMATVQGRVSEKWFYTYCKVAEPPRLPREDMLDLLARYAGHANWAAFRAQAPAPRAVRVRRPWIAGGLVASLFLGLTIWGLVPRSVPPHTFCFVDAYTQQPVTDPLQVFWLRPGESPQRLPLRDGHCVQLPLPAGTRAGLVVEAPYYHRDTLWRSGSDTARQEVVVLRPDDYARMITYFASGAESSWARRRAQLADILDPEVQVFHLHPQTGLAMDVYNQEEFIDRLTLPSRDLRNLRIVATAYSPQGKINLLHIMTDRP